jgi:hypothetical protein
VTDWVLMHRVADKARRCRENLVIEKVAGLKAMLS